MRKSIYAVAAAILLFSAAPASGFMWECHGPGGDIRFTSSKPKSKDCELIEWVTYAKVSGISVSLNQRTLAKSGRNWKTWSLWSFKESRKLDSSPPREYRSLKQLDYYNCSEHTSAIARGTCYAGENGKGEVVCNWASQPDEIKLTDVGTGTVGEKLLKEVCRMARSLEHANGSASPLSNE